MNEIPIAEIIKVQFQTLGNKVKIVIPNITQSVKFSIYDYDSGSELFSTVENTVNGKVKKKFDLATKYENYAVNGRTY